jgi:tetratricopeptide (TPR) repeat protein
MKNLFTSAAILLAGISFGQRGVTIPQTASPLAKTEQSVGLSTIQIEYSRPSVMSRRGDDRTGKIWGELVPYELSAASPGFGSGNDFPWRAGANKNTVITLSHDAMIEEKAIPAGTYGFHIIPHEDSSATLVFSSNYSSWGSYYYDKAEDVLRVDVQLEATDFNKRLTFDFIDLSESSATVCLDWEYMRFPFRVSFESAEIIYTNISNQLRDQLGFGWEPPFQAAEFCIARDIHLDQAEKWLDRSLASEENFDNTYAKSQLLAKQGKDAEAKELKDKALAMPSATANDYYTVGSTILAKYRSAEDEAAKKKHAGEALAFFQTANKKFDEELLLNYGLAQSYSATGDYKKAIASAKKSKELTESERTKTFLDGLITKLEAGEDIN